MISLLADRIDSSSAAALQGVGKSALRDMRQRSVNRREGEGEREFDLFLYSPIVSTIVNRIIRRIVCIYICVCALLLLGLDDFLTRDYSIKLNRNGVSARV